MYVTQANSPLAIVADCRLKSDAQLDETEGGQHVLELMRFVREILGINTYLNCKRIALFDYRGAETATVEERAEARATLRGSLLKYKSPKVCIVIPTADVSEDGDAQKAETVAWGAFKAPDSMAAMRGCAYEWTNERYVIPVYAPTGSLKELQKWEMLHWFQRALRLAQSLQRDPPHSCSPLRQKLAPDILLPHGVVAGVASSGSQATMLNALTRMDRNGRPLAVDIESIEATGTITAIGLSDGSEAVSVNWEPYLPHGHNMRQLGIFGEEPCLGEVAQRVEELLAKKTVKKCFHNHTFDIPRLEGKGLKVGGEIEDTFAASAIAYPELRHGLQAAAATCIPCAIPPWKSLWHPKLKGISRDDIEYWTCDPKALLDYNAKDAFYTWHLAAAVLPAVGRQWYDRGAETYLAGTPSDLASS